MTAPKAGSKGPAASTKKAAATSGDVARWGRQWLREWVAAAETLDDRQQRERTAQCWQEWSLEQWAHSITEERRVYRAGSEAAYAAGVAAEAHLSLYLRERVGLLVWRAYAEYRARGEQVPESILVKFDQWAQRLEAASGTREVAQAIEMTDGSGGPQGAALVAAIERQRLIVSEVHRLRARNVPASMAHARVAATFGTSVGAVKAACIRWWRKRSPSETNAEQILRNLGRGR